MNDTGPLAVPPPEGRGISLLDERAVQQIAGRLKKIVEAWDRADTPRFLVRYRAFASQGYEGGIWQVLLLDWTAEAGTLLRAYVAIDDATRLARLFGLAVTEGVDGRERAWRVALRAAARADVALPPGHFCMSRSASGLPGPWPTSESTRSSTGRSAGSPRTTRATSRPPM